MSLDKKMDDLPKTILIVEDNEQHMEYNVFLLKKLGFNTLIANSGEEALELLKSKDIDCILLDINLGKGMSGIELMKLLRNKTQYETIPIAAISAYYGGGMHEILLNEGFSDFLAKPVTINQLRELLDQYFPSFA
jgi:CheY-like chemotaxis protein